MMPWKVWYFRSVYGDSMNPFNFPGLVILKEKTRIKEQHQRLVFDYDTGILNLPMELIKD